MTSKPTTRERPMQLPDQEGSPVTRGPILEPPFHQASAGDTAAMSQQIQALEQQLAALKARLGVEDETGGLGHAEGDRSTRTPAISRRGLLATAAGAAAGLVVAQAAPAAAANGDPVLLGTNNTATETTFIETSVGDGIWAKSSEPGRAGLAGYSLATTDLGPGVVGHSAAPYGTGVFGSATRYGVQGAVGANTGEAFGIWGLSTSTGGRGVFGRVKSLTGFTHGVHGEVDSTSGRGVFGIATATSGRAYGVYGQSDSGAGYGMYCSGRFKATSRTFLGAPSSAPSDGDINNGMVSFYLDQATNKLKVRVRYSNGVYKTGSVNLA